MAAPTGYRPWRFLGLLGAIILVMTAMTFWPGQNHTPKLGLDLRGGTQVILDPAPITAGAEINEEQLQQTVEILRQRVDGVGVAESEIAIQGSGNDAVIVVSVPDIPQDRIVDLVGRTALLDFRPVDSILNPAPATGDAAGQAGDGGGDAPKKKQSADANAVTQTDSDATATDDATQGAEIVQAKTNDAAFQKQVLALDCTLPQNQAGGTPDDPELWLGTCDRDGAAKFVLEPAFIRGTDIATAAAQLPQQGAGGWVVTMDFNSAGASQLAEISKKLSALPEPKNQFAIVLDGVVVSAPSFREPILGGQAQIEGNFSAEEAQDLANVLKFGALPLTLNVQAVDNISPTLGQDYLWAGLLAGIIGMALVCVFLFLYYRVLGLVAIASLFIAGWMSYCAFVILGNSIGFALTLAGIAGAIVSIGITADSFIVYFERIRDEIRDGKSLRRAVDDGWVRARRTLLASDFVSILAAVVLYVLSVGNVRGFAFALGLTTLMDIVVSFWFTRPAVTLIARSKWMQKGSWFTGMTPARIGVDSSLAGSGADRRPARRPVRAGSGGPATDTRKLGGEV